MSAPLLTADEIAALKSTQGGGGTRVVPVDVLGGERSARKALAALERLLAPAATATETGLARALHQPCVVDVKPAEIVGPQAAALALEAQIQSVRLRGGSETLAIVGIEPSLAFALVESAFGAALAPGQAVAVTVPARDRLTTVERRVVDPFLLELAGVLGRSMRSEGAEIANELVTSPIVLPPCCDYVVLRRLDVTCGSAGGAVVTTVFPALLGALRSEGAPTIASADRERMSALLGGAPLEISVDLGAVELPVAELLALRPGDVLRLDRGQSDLLPIAVEGVTKLWGRPVQRNGVFGVEVVKEIS